MTGFHARLLNNPIQVEEGYVHVPTQAGLGITLNDEVRVPILMMAINCIWKWKQTLMITPIVENLPGTRQKPDNGLTILG